jgi:hypothetical protein
MGRKPPVSLRSASVSRLGLSSLVDRPPFRGGLDSPLVREPVGPNGIGPQKILNQTRIDGVLSSIQNSLTLQPKATPVNRKFTASLRQLTESEAAAAQYGIS